MPGKSGVVERHAPYTESHRTRSVPHRILTIDHNFTYTIRWQRLPRAARTRSGISCLHELHVYNQVTAAQYSFNEQHFINFLQDAVEIKPTDSFPQDLRIY
ncbi:hypothetical protein J6590_022573 [Homalodisca vitripennis]|nr:hypothetical protein J6590_022573 [Homalodisca vitripennis]